jgi:DHA2 family lincomycin resistance protein-like MFS transporter
MSSAPARPGAEGAAGSTASMPEGSVRLIALLVGSAFVVILNETIMGVALPELMREFDVPASSAQWLTTIFLLTMAVVIPVSGWALRRFSLRSVFVTAMATFTVGTLLAALAPSFGVLVGARAVQAFGTALMMPLLITTVMSLVPASRRGQMMGVISIVISVAPAVGPTISGVILDQLSWRWMFWLVLPIAVLSLVVGSIWVRNVTEQVRVTLDVGSVVLSALAFSGLVYGLSSIGESASGDTLMPVWLPLVVGAAALVLFVLRQLRLREQALLDLRAFGSSTFSIALTLMAVSMMTLFGALILLPLYLQDVLGMSTLATGLTLLPGGLVMGLLAPFVGAAFDRFGPRPLVAPGVTILSAGLWLMTRLDGDSTQGTVITLHVILSIGLALALTPLMTSALGSLPAHLYAHGSAILSTVQQVAGAAGTALFITVMTRRLTSSADAGAGVVEATADGVHDAFVYGAVISLVAIVVALFVRSPKIVDVAEVTAPAEAAPADGVAARP